MRQSSREEGVFSGHGDGRKKTAAEAAVSWQAINARRT
jgi:hypothetical protein